MEEFSTSGAPHRHVLSPKVHQEIMAEILPKIKLVHSTKLLSKGKAHTNQSVTLDRLPALDGKSRATVDISSKELLQTTEWLAASEQDEETLTKDSVKHLEQWAYTKKLHQQNDTKYRQLLRQSISKQIASTGEELFNSETMKSCIVATITEQLAEEREDQPVLMKRKTSLMADLASLELTGSVGDSATKAMQRLRQDLLNKESNLMKRIDQELVMELQTLRMKKELVDRKAEQKRLLETNSALLTQVEEQRHSIEAFTNRKNSPKLNDSLSSSGTVTHRTRTRKGGIQRDGSMTFQQQSRLKQVEVARAKERTQAQVSAMEKDIAKLKKEHEANLKRIHTLEYEMSQIKPEIDANIKKQIDYYYGLLEEGKDARNAGLSWIIKCIWYLEKKFPTQARFPTFLEEETVACILKACALDILKDRAERELRSITSLNRKAALETYNPESDPALKPELAPSKGKEKSEHTTLSPARLKLLALTLSQRAKQAPRQIRNAQEVMCEEKVAKILLQIKELKRTEISRIAKNYIKKSLQGKQPSIHITEVLCAILGDYYGLKEYGKILKRREELVRSWEKNLSFVFVKPVKKKKKKSKPRISVSLPVS